MAQKQCTIVDIIVNPNGTGVVHYRHGDYPLSGEEDIQAKGFGSLAGLVADILGLEASLIEPDAQCILTLSQYVKDDPIFSNLANATGKTSIVSLTDSADPINFG